MDTGNRNVGCYFSKAATVRMNGLVRAVIDVIESDLKLIKKVIFAI